MNRVAYESVLDSFSPPGGGFWLVPIVFDVGESVADNLSIGDKVALRDSGGFMSAVLTVGSLWHLDRRQEAEQIYGTMNESHPGVRYLPNSVKPVYIGGRIEGVQPPLHHDFEYLLMTDEPDALPSISIRNRITMPETTAGEILRCLPAG